MEGTNNTAKKLEHINIDYSLYSSQPEKLISIAQERQIKNNFAQSINILKHSVELAQKKFGGVYNIELVHFYNKYADSILQNMMANPNSNTSISNIKEESNDNNVINNYIPAPDSKTAFEYLSKANMILKRYLEQYNNKDKCTLDKDIIKYYLYLADNYNLLATLEKLNFNFENAINYYKLSINYTKKYDSIFSRNLAGLYFELAQILFYDPFNCLLSLYKSKVIMEYYLQREITKSNLNVKLIIEENDLELQLISYNNEKINQNKKIIENNIELNEAMKTNLVIKEFVDIIKDINSKIQNVVLEVEEYNIFRKRREQKRKDEKNDRNNEDNLDLELEYKNNEIHMNKISLINIKRSEPSNNDEDFLKMEQDYSKEKYQ